MEEYQIFIEEIKLAQKRIIHNETLIWSIGSILNSSIIILFGISINKDVGTYYPFIILASILVSLLWIFFEFRYRAINDIFYKRIHALEKKIGFNLHSKLDKFDKRKKSKIHAHNLIIGMAILLPTILILQCLFSKYNLIK